MAQKALLNALLSDSPPGADELGPGGVDGSTLNAGIEDGR